MSKFITMTWTELKALKALKVAEMQWRQTDLDGGVGYYDIWVQEFDTYWTTRVAITVVRNTDQIDFEDNVQPTANQAIALPVNITNTSVPVNVTNSGSGVIEHHNGTANIAVATVTFSATIKHVQIENMNSANDLLVSFDGGTLFKTLQPGTILDVDGTMADLKIKASADGTSYEILAIV